MELLAKLGNENDFKSKYKTEICRNWTQGCCEFGDKCTFAHGYDELRNKDYLASNYRTKNCKQFHEQGFCQYGSRCQFKHIEVTSEKVKRLSHEDKTAPCSPRESSPRDNKKRLPIFIKLSQED